MSDLGRIKLLVIEDHDIVRQGLMMVLELDDDIQVVGDASDGRELEKLIENTNPNMVLLDLELPYIHGIALCKRIKTSWPEIRVLFLTAYMEDNMLIEAIRSGADGYLLKDIEKDSLTTTIKDTFAGRNTLHPEMISVIFDRIKKGNNRLFPELSPIEENLLGLIGEGKTNKEVSKAMGLAEKTIRNYSSLLFKKIGVENRTEASIYYNKRRNSKGYMSRD
jgi:DNA-binding NarL/FixJ family response regulator